MEEMRDEINKKKKDKWIEVWMAIEALAVDKSVVENSLREHIEKLCNIKDAFVYEKMFLDAVRVEKPLKDVEEAYSQVVETRLFAKDLYTLINIVLVYGPSSIEIIGPNNHDTKIDEMQNTVNVLAGLIHQFAAAGVGGIVLSPGK